MKRIILSIVTLFIITTSFAQNDVKYFEKKNELNIQVNDIFQRNDIYSVFDYYSDLDHTYMYISDYGNSPSVGIGYKRHFDKGAIRVSGSMYLSSRTYKNDEDDKNDDESFAFYYERVAAGYEYHQNWGKTQVFFGIDGTIGFQTTIEKEKYNIYEKDYGDIKSTYSTFSFGIRPFIGFKYMITPKFSVSTEYHLLAERNVSKTKTEMDGEESDNVYKTTGFSSKFGPKGQITFSYYF